MGEKIDAVTVSTPDHTHAAGQRHGDADGQALLLPEAADLVGRRSPRHARAGRARRRSATQMGNQGTAEDGFREGVEVLRAGRPRAGQGDPRLDQPPDLAAGDRPARRRRRASRTRPLGRVPRPGARPALQPGLSPVHLARLAGLRHRRPGRHGLPHHQRRRHGPGAVRPRVGRGRRHLGDRRQGDVSRLVDHPHPVRQRGKPRPADA